MYCFGLHVLQFGEHVVQTRVCVVENLHYTQYYFHAVCLLCPVAHNACNLQIGRALAVQQPDACSQMLLICYAEVWTINPGFFEGGAEARYDALHMCQRWVGEGTERGHPIMPRGSGV
jgi:hypothetical protein